MFLYCTRQNKVFRYIICTFAKNSSNDGGLKALYHLRVIKKVDEIYGPARFSLLLGTHHTEIFSNRRKSLFEKKNLDHCIHVSKRNQQVSLLFSTVPQKKSQSGVIKKIEFGAPMVQYDKMLTKKTCALSNVLTHNFFNF